jgi:hypothetical protein
MDGSALDEAVVTLVLPLVLGDLFGRLLAGEAAEEGSEVVVLLEQFDHDRSHG